MSEGTSVEFESNGLTGEIVQSIMTPGYTAKGVIQIMFYTFYALFATLLTMVFMTGGNPHVIALLLLSVCLFVTIKWFIKELEQAKIEEERKKNKNE